MYMHTLMDLATRSLQVADLLHLGLPADFLQESDLRHMSANMHTCTHTHPDLATHMLHLCGETVCVHAHTLRSD